MDSINGMKVFLSLIQFKGVQGKWDQLEWPIHAKDKNEALEKATKFARQLPAGVVVATNLEKR